MLKAMASKKPGKKAALKRDSGASDIADFLGSLDEPVRRMVLELRDIVLQADSRINEGIKWNVLSFRTAEYFATLHLRRKQGIGVVMHFGARKNSISETGVAIPDPEEMLHWLAKDRAMLEFDGMNDIRRRRDAFTALIREWIRHV
jgi:hypothetical protein